MVFFPAILRDHYTTTITNTTSMPIHKNITSPYERSLYRQKRTRIITLTHTKTNTTTLPTTILQIFNFSIYLIYLYIVYMRTLIKTI